MTAPTHHQFQKFARPLPPGCCAIGDRRCSLPASVATLNHSQRQTSRHDAAGAAACRVEALAVGKTGRRFAGLGCFIAVHLVGTVKRPNPFGQFSGIGRRANVPVANIIHHRHQGRFQRFAKGHKRHFPMSFRTHRLDSHDANENGLTDAQIAFAPGAKTYD